MMKICNFLKAILFFFILVLSINKAFSVTLDAVYEKDLHKRPLLKIVNYEINLARQYAVIANKDLENLEDIKLYIGLLKQAFSTKNYSSEKEDKMFLGPLIVVEELTARLSKHTDAPKSITLAIRNIQRNLVSIKDKADLVIGGASPMAMSFYTSEILKQFNFIKNGEDLDNDEDISLEKGEGGLDYITTWIVSAK